jgi:hypothetical protein
MQLKLILKCKWSERMFCLQVQYLSRTDGRRLWVHRLVLGSVRANNSQTTRKRIPVSVQTFSNADRISIWNARRIEWNGCGLNRGTFGSWSRYVLCSVSLNLLFISRRTSRRNANQENQGRQYIAKLHSIWMEELRRETFARCVSWCSFYFQCLLLLFSAILTL